MAVRAQLDLAPNAAKTKSYTVAAGQSAVEGRAMSFAAADEECQLTAAGGAPFGMFLETKAAGEKVQVLIGRGDAITKVKVGTGGATRGQYGVVVADGMTNAPTLGGGTVLRNIAGVFTQSGVAGDVVGFIFNPFAAASA